MDIYKRYAIGNDKLKIEISETGAELKSLLTKKKIEYMWTADNKYWGRTAPFLFPIVGTLKDKKTIINNKTYMLMQHGFLRDQTFYIEKATSNSLTFINKFNDNTLRVYPFEYEARIKYTIDDTSVNVDINIKNIGNVDMPFNLGGHPGFNCPLYVNEQFSDYSIYFDKKETFVSPFVTNIATLDFTKEGCRYTDLEVLPLDKKLFDIDTIIIKDIKSKSVKLLNKENKGIKFEFPNFSTLAIWTPYNEAPFVCLEPWIGYNDHHDSDYDFLKKDDLITLKPNEDFTATYKITIID